MSAMTTTTTQRAPTCFTVDGQQVYGFLHRPSAATDKLPAVLILHGFLASKDQPHRIFVELAEALARAGMLSLRIDLRGRGDSEGESIDITPAADLADVAAALDYLAQHPDVDANRIGVLGMSWGGTLAAVIAGRDGRVGPVVIWSSDIAELEWGWLSQLSVFDGREAADNWAQLVGRPFYDGLAELHPPAEVRTARGPFFVVYGTADDVAHSIPATKTTLAAAGIPHEVMAVEGADHIFLSYAWKKQVIEATVAWLAGKI
jgi:dienelactone hydrolase